MPATPLPARSSHLRQTNSQPCFCDGCSALRGKKSIRDRSIAGLGSNNHLQGQLLELGPEISHCPKEPCPGPKTPNSSPGLLQVSVSCLALPTACLCRATARGGGQLTSFGSRHWLFGLESRETPNKLIYCRCFLIWGRGINTREPG